MTSAAWDEAVGAGLGLDGNYWTGLLEDPLPTRVVVIREGEGLEASFEIFIQSISVAGLTPSLLKMILYYKLHEKKKKMSSSNV